MESRIRRIFLSALAFTSLAGGLAFNPATAAEQV